MDQRGDSLSLTVADVSSHCIRAFASSSSVAETIVHVVRRLVSRLLRPVLSFRLVRHSRPARLRRRRFTTPPASPRSPSPTSPCCPAGCLPTLHGGRDHSRRRRSRGGGPAAANSRIAAAHPRRPPPRAAAVAADPIVATPAGADAAVSGAAGATDRGSLGEGDSKVPGANVRIVAPANCAHAA